MTNCDVHHFHAGLYSYLRRGGIPSSEIRVGGKTMTWTGHAAPHSIGHRHLICSASVRFYRNPFTVKHSIGHEHIMCSSSVRFYRNPFTVMQSIGKKHIICSSSIRFYRNPFTVKHSTGYEHIICSSSIRFYRNPFTVKLAAPSPSFENDT